MVTVNNCQGGGGESFDQQLHALASIQRRTLLFELLAECPQDDKQSVLDLSETPGGEGHRALQMRHAHLPTLEDHGFITWNQDGDTVARGPAFDDIRPLLELLQEHEDELPPDLR